MPFVAVSASTTTFGPEFPSVSNTATINATAKNGYPGSAPDSVGFTYKAGTGLTVSLSGTSCITGGGTCSITISLSASTYGNYSATVYGVYVSQDPLKNNETLSGSVTIRLIVYDYLFSIAPKTLTFVSGEIGTATATLSSKNGFAGSVILANSLVSPPDLVISYSPDPVILSRGGTSTSTITFKASPPSAMIYHALIKAPFGTHSITATALTISVSAPVPDFYFVATPSSIGPINAGASGSSTLAINYVNGFTGTVTLTIPSSSSGLNVKLNQTSVTATHNVTITASAPVAGSYGFQVSGTNGTIVHLGPSISVAVVDFNLVAGPNSLSIDQGTFGVSDIAVVAVNGFSGTVSLTTIASQGLTANLSRSTIAGPGFSVLNVTLATSISPGLYTVNVTGVSGSLQHVAQVNVTIVANDFSILAIPTLVAARPNTNATSMITISSLHSFVGTVGLTVTAPAGVTATFDATSVTLRRGGSVVSTLTLNSTTTGSFHIDVTAAGGSITHKVGLTFVVSLPDFSISGASQQQITVSEGSSGSITVTVSADTGFTGTISISLGAAVVPASPQSFTGDLPTMSLSSSTVTLASGASAVITVTVTVNNRVLPNLFGVTVSATNAGRVHQASFTLTVPPSKFVIASSPSTVIVGPGGTGSSTITVASQGGLFGVVTLSLAQLPGLTCSLTPTSVTLAAGGSATTMLTCSGSVGSYNETITGQGTTPFDAGLTEYGSASFVVADFSLSSTPSSGILVNTGQTAHASISVSWNPNYSGTVNLRVIAQSGLDATLNSASITGAGSTTLNVVSNTAGTYRVVVNATSGSSSHSVTLTVTVTSTSNVSSLDPAILYSGIGVLLAAIVAGVLLLSRRRKQSK
jgi:hypothetical protein